ncbi:OmpA family protein [Stakelama saccharophila]|uniref:OmpA family protein n=1 Tax=Stakelama saccharophila TaxID=3075605 RepID=A0ABZ0B9F0_9SPHN|nr:OmpA family protein [Stakelama sp. W311]WNO53680.1 OmpA family protein [Stakelama sp. W311]
MTSSALSRFGTAPERRPLWLTTLADLGLLLIGFFVFLQANDHLDGPALADSLRAGFVHAEAAPSPMPVDRARVGAFAPGSAVLPAQAPAAIAWARGAARDPRTAIEIAGGTDGTAADVDPATGSAMLLANARARAVAEALIAVGAVRPDQIVITRPAADRRRSVTLSLGYAGGRQ